MWHGENLKPILFGQIGKSEVIGYIIAYMVDIIVVAEVNEVMNFFSL